MMENAGAVWHTCSERFYGDVRETYCGLGRKGGNGGGALVAARRLHNWAPR